MSIHKTHEDPITPQTTKLPLSLLPLSISPFGNKAPKGRRSYSWGGEDGVDWLGAAMKQSESSSELSEEMVGETGVIVGGAEEVGGAEDATASVTTLVESVRGVVETGTVSVEEGRTAVGRIGSNVRVVIGRDCRWVLELTKHLLLLKEKGPLLLGHPKLLLSSCWSWRRHRKHPGLK